MDKSVGTSIKKSDGALHHDLAGREHWNSVYRSGTLGTDRWFPADYNSVVLERALVGQVEQTNARSVLEVGCGNSSWLSYLAHKTGAAVTGLDYSEAGCMLARQRLSNERVDGKVICGDLFQADVESVGQHDFVFSLGLVEHFGDLVGTLAKLLTFVRPGGTLFTEVPNLKSIHGLLSWLWQPELFAKHRVITKGQLLTAYERLGLQSVSGHHIGMFSLDIVAWEIYPRWPALAPSVAPRVRRVNKWLDALLRRREWFHGSAPLSPFIYVVGKKL